MMYSFLDTATATSSAASGTTTGSGGWIGTLMSLLPIVLILVVFYFLLIRPQNKREKKMQEMRNAVQIGDEIVTSSGIIGIVISVKDDNIVIETGSDRSKIRIKRWAIQSNETIHENAEQK